jgi:hypothetical protein
LPTSFDALRSELLSAAFDAAYRSRVQRRRRGAAAALLLLKHTVRGIAFSWPLYLIAGGAFLPGAPSWLFLVLPLPGLSVSGFILARGVREDIRGRVRGHLLRAGDWRHGFLPRA